MEKPELNHFGAIFFRGKRNHSTLAVELQRSLGKIFSPENIVRNCGSIELPIETSLVLGHERISFNRIDVTWWQTW